jgi:alpha-beta hydrolase superfamily lysophospholipase
MAGARDDKFVGLQTSMREAGFPGTFLVVEEAGHRLLAAAPDAVAAAFDDLVA